MRRAVALLAVLGGVLAGCGGDGSRTSASTSASTSVGAPAQGGDAPEALQLSAPLVGGGTIDLTQYAGTTVALWFWAPT